MNAPRNCRFFASAGAMLTSFVEAVRSDPDKRAAFLNSLRTR